MPSCKHAHAYTHTRTHAYTHTHTHTRMHTGTHMHAHAQLFTHTYPFCPDGTFVSGRGRWAARLQRQGAPHSHQR